jgi:hypothetical protein
MRLQLSPLQAATSIVICSTCPPPIGGSRPSVVVGGDHLAGRRKHAAEHVVEDGEGIGAIGGSRSSRSVVAVLAAYSGLAAAAWGTESSVSLAKACALRTKANRADLETKTAERG